MNATINRSGSHSPIDLEAPQRDLSFSLYHVVQPENFKCSLCQDDDCVTGVRITAAGADGFHLVCKICVDHMSAVHEVLR